MVSDLWAYDDPSSLLDNSILRYPLTLVAPMTMFQAIFA